MSNIDLNRREFLKGSAIVGTGLVVGTGSASTLADSNDVPLMGDDAVSLNSWIQIKPDNTICFWLDKAEMGQGVTTGMTTIVGEYLDVNPDMIKIAFAPNHDEFKNPEYGVQATGGSSSVRTAWQPLQTAAATARQLLIEAAAEQWGIRTDQCNTDNSYVINTVDNKRLSYGELASRASQLNTSAVTIKEAKDFKYIGKDEQKRLDGYAKVTGQATFGIDAKVPGVKVAVVARCPVFGGKLKAYDDSVALKMPGVIAVLPVKAGVAVVADNYWQARKGLGEVTIDWLLGANENLDSQQIEKEYQQVIQQEGDIARADGDVEAAFAGAGKTIEATYKIPFLAHAPMEPMNCTVSVTKNSCQAWVPTQSVGITFSAVKMVTGLPDEAIEVNATYMGGAFGRRSGQDFTIDALEISKALEIPIQVIWSREDDMRHDYYRPATYNTLKASVKDGKISGWQHAIAAPSISAYFMSPEVVGAALPSWLPNGVVNFASNTAQRLYRGTLDDKSTAEGAADLPYDIESVKVSTHFIDKGIPLGYWRSVGHSQNAFIVESFLDELAHLMEKDPYQLRMDMLSKYPEHQAVLKLAAEKANWGNPPAGRYQGIAVHKSFFSYVAEVAEVSITGKQINVHKVTCAIDCGQAINPDIVRQQMEGGILYGLTAALKGKITLDKGGVEQGNFDTYPLLRMNEAPVVEVHILASNKAPTGVGEPATPPIAPAVANAVFAATGQRLREMPLRLS